MNSYNPTDFQMSQIATSYYYTSQMFSNAASSHLGLGQMTVLQEWDNVIHTLVSLNELEDNWDGYGGASIAKSAQNNALGIANYLRRVLKFVPEVSPTSGGTISFLWETANAEAYLEVGDEKYSGYLQIGEFPTSLLDGYTNNFNPLTLCPYVASMAGSISFAKPTSNIIF